MVPRNFSQDQGTLLPYVYVLLGLKLVVRGVAAAAWRAGGQYNRGAAGSACGVERQVGKGGKLPSVESNKSS